MNTLPSNPDIDLLERWSHQNGSRYWLAHEFLEHLGFHGMKKPPEGGCGLVYSALWREVQCL